MPGKNYLALLDLAVDRYGFITPDDARELGIDPATLPVMARRRQLTHVDHGLYRFPTVATTPLEPYMQATLWPQVEACLSHETALDLYELCDVNPHKIHVTVPSAYRLRRDLPGQYRLHKRDLPKEDVTLFEGIPMVTPLRAIRDGIDAHLGNRMIHQAIDNALKRGLVPPAQRAMLQRATLDA